MFRKEQRQGDWSGERERDPWQRRWREGRDQARRDLQGALRQEDPRLSRCEMKDGARPSRCGSVV